MSDETSSWDGPQSQILEADRYELDDQVEMEAASGSAGLPSRKSAGPTRSEARSKPALSQKRSNLSKLAIGAALLVAAGIPTYPTLRTLLLSEGNQYANLVTEKVTRGPFAITVTDNGELNSISNVTIVSKVDETTTILWLIPEGTIVKEGDLVCELDSAKFREEAKQQEIAVNQAEAAEAQAEEALKIQRIQNESDTAAAELAWMLAKLDLDKWKLGDFLQQQDEFNGEIQLKQEELQRAREKYDFSKRIAKKGYISQNELEADRMAVNKAAIILKAAEGKLAVLEDYTNGRTVTELEANNIEMKREINRADLKAKAAEAQYEKDYDSLKLTAEVQRAKYQRRLRQLEACKLLAPQAGQVVYAKPNSRSRNPTNIEEGASVRERQEIIYLPDYSQMKVEAGIHESRINLVKEGLPVIIHVDAYPDEIFHGVVETVDTVPKPGRWPNYDLKEYEANILMKKGEKTKKLKPGLTAQIEILVNQRDYVLQIPVQSVVAVGEKRVTFVLTKKGPERRELLIGDSSDTAIEILDGIEKGDRIVMNPRTHFADEIQELESQLAAAMAKPESAAPLDDSQQLDDADQSSSKARSPKKNADENGSDKKKWLGGKS